MNKEDEESARLEGLGRRSRHRRHSRVASHRRSAIRIDPIAATTGFDPRAAWLLPLLAGFAVGWIVRGFRGRDRHRPDAVCVPLYGDGTAGATSDAVAEYASWAQAATGRIPGSPPEKLEPGGETVGIPSRSGEEMLGGLFIIPAQTDEEARRIAEQHPPREARRHNRDSPNRDSDLIRRRGPCRRSIRNGACCAVKMNGFRPS